MFLFNIYLLIHWNFLPPSKENILLIMVYLYLYAVRFFKYLKKQPGRKEYLSN